MYNIKVYFSISIYCSKISLWSALRIPSDRQLETLIRNHHECFFLTNHHMVLFCFGVTKQLPWSHYNAACQTNVTWITQTTSYFKSSAKSFKSRKSSPSSLSKAINCQIRILSRLMSFKSFYRADQEDVYKNPSESKWLQSYRQCISLIHWFLQVTSYAKKWLCMVKREA